MGKIPHPALAAHWCFCPLCKERSSVSVHYSYLGIASQRGSHYTSQSLPIPLCFPKKTLRGLDRTFLSAGIIHLVLAGLVGTPPFPQLRELQVVSDTINVRVSPCTYFFTYITSLHVQYVLYDQYTCHLPAISCLFA